MRPDDLLASWGDYMEGPEYAAERERSLRDKPPSQQESQRQLKLQCHRLRNQRRWAMHLLRQRTLPSTQADIATVEYFKSGALDEALRQATEEHGFGKVYYNDGTYTILRHTTFMDTWPDAAP